MAALFAASIQAQEHARGIHDVRRPRAELARRTCRVGRDARPRKAELRASRDARWRRHSTPREMAHAIGERPDSRPLRSRRCDRSRSLGRHRSGAPDAGRYCPPRSLQSHGMSGGPARRGIRPEISSAARVGTTTVTVGWTWLGRGSDAISGCASHALAGCRGESAGQTYDRIVACIDTYYTFSSQLVG